MSLKRIKVPTVSVNTPSGRDYIATLQQTKLVYDELLANKMAKMMKDLFVRKDQLDAKCEELARSSEDKAMEYAVSAQEQLNKLHQKNMTNLKALTITYQKNLDKLQESLEATHGKKHQPTSTAV